MLQRRRLCGAGLLAAALGATALAARADDAATEPPPEVRAVLGAARLQGQGLLRFLGLRVYDARLWVPAGQAVAGDSPQAPLALEIRYHRKLQGREIAERSLQEMRRQGEIDEPTAQRWLQAMKAWFPDVREGSRITGLHLQGGAVQFHVDGQLRGSLQEPEFARRFFGIWLSPQTSDPKLRAALLGLPGTASS